MDVSVTFAVAVLAGVLSFLSPCVLPLVPSYLCFVTGVSLDELERGERRIAIFWPALAFVLGFSLVFLALGASATLLGRLLFFYQDWIARVGGLLIAAFGLHLLGVFRATALLRDRRVHLKSRPAGLLGAVGAGIVFGAGWTPCIGPVLGSILTFAAERATWSGAMVLLGGYSLGLALPFLAAALGMGAFLRSARHFRPLLPAVQKVSGALLIVAGLLLMTGTYQTLAAYLIQLTPEFLVERL